MRRRVRAWRAARRRRSSIALGRAARASAALAFAALLGAVPGRCVGGLALGHLRRVAVHCTPGQAYGRKGAADVAVVLVVLRRAMGGGREGACGVVAVTAAHLWTRLYDVEQRARERMMERRTKKRVKPEAPRVCARGEREREGRRPK